MQYVLKLFFLSVLIGFCFSLEFDLSLQDTYQIQVNYNVENIPLAVGRDYNVPPGRVQVQIGSLELSTFDVTSRLNGDVLEIDVISEIVDSINQCNTFSDDTSYSEKSLCPLSGLLFVLLGFSLFGRFDKKFLSIISIIVLLVVVAESINVSDKEVIINFSPFDDITELIIISKSSVLVDSKLREVCQAGRAQTSLSTCHGFVCNINDEGCISSDFQKIGSLVPLNDNLASSFVAGIETAGNKFGNRLPETQVIIASSDTESIAVQSAQRLYNMGCRHIIGPFYSSNVLAVLEWSQTVNDIPMIISPISSSTNLNRFDNYFSVYTSNDELGKAYCNYISEITNNRIFDITIYAVTLNTEYTQNLLSVMVNQCGNLNINIIPALSYDSIDNLDDAIPILNQLNNIIEESNNDISTIGIMHFGFSEIRYLLEALSETGGVSSSAYWFSSDAAFDKFAISSSPSRNTGASVGLTSMTFIGYNPDLTIGIRSETLAEITRLSGSVDFWSTFAHDSAMLMYLTLERMGDLSNQSNLFPSYLEQTSKSVYGATGYLGIGENSFRELNEYLVGYPAPDDAIFSFDWIATSYFRYNSHGKDTLSFEEEIHKSKVKYYNLNKEDIDCDTFNILAEIRDYLNIPYLAIIDQDSFDEFNGTIELSQFSNLTIIISCEDKTGRIFCPPNTRYDETRCLKSTEDVAVELPIYNFKSTETGLLTGTTVAGLGNGDSTPLIPQDNMYSAFDGAQGTTLDTKYSNREPMNLNVAFP